MAHCDHKVVAGEFEIVVEFAADHTVVVDYSLGERNWDDNSAQTKELKLGGVVAYEVAESVAAVGEGHGVEAVGDRAAGGAEAVEDHAVEAHGAMVHGAVAHVVGSADRYVVAAAIEDLRSHPVAEREAVVDSEPEDLCRALAVVGHWDHCIQQEDPVDDSGEGLDFVEDHCNHFEDGRMVLTRESHLDLLDCHPFRLEARDLRVEVVDIVEAAHSHTEDAAEAADSEEEDLEEEAVVGRCIAGLPTSCETVAAEQKQFSIDGSQVVLGSISGVWYASC